MSGVQPTTGPPPAASGGSGGQQQSTAQSHEDAQKQQQPVPAQARPAVSLSASLAPLAEGQRFEAQVAGQDADGLPLVRSDNGSFAIVGDTEPLPPNARLVLQVLTLGTTVRAAVLSANGEALHPPPQISLELTRAAPAALAAPAEQAAPTTPIPPITQATQLAQAATPNRLLPEFVTAPGPAAAALSPAAAGLAAGAPLVAKLVAGSAGLLTGPAAGPAHAAGPGAGHDGPTFLLRVLSIGSAPAPAKAPGAAATPAGTAATAAAKAASHGAAAGTAGAKGGTASGAPAAGGHTSTTAPAPAPAGRAAAIPGYDAAAAARAVGNRLDGMIVGTNAAGQVLFRSPAGLLALQSKASLPAGTPLSVEVVSKTTPADKPATGPLTGPQPAATAFEPLAGLLADTGNWPALRDTLEVLATLEPALAAQLVAKAIPMPNKRLTSTLLFFFTALRGGDIRQWLGGNVMRALERAGRRDLLDKLDDDFAHVRRLTGDAGGGDWRTLIMPLYDGHELHQLMLFYRHHGRRDDDDEGGEDSTRFVLNLILSSLGPMQLDGLVQDHRFNLFVRSKDPLDKSVQGDLSHIFSQALDATGWTGTLAFQVGGRFPVSPLEDVAREVHGGGLVV